MKKLRWLLVLLLVLIPINTFALSDNYVDKVHDIVDKKVEKDKINIYFFRGEGCPHCADEEKWFKSIEKKYKDYINIYDFEVWKSKDNAELLDKVKKEMGSKANGVPFTVIGDEYFVGFSEVSKSKIENTIKDYIGEDVNKNEMKIPVMGKIDAKKVSLPLVAIILGFIDGFNPCAMWILLFLINMLFREENKKKAWILGFTFLLVSGLVYFLSMLGINFVLSVVAIKWLKVLLAIFILVAGILNMKKYLKTRKEEAGCTVVDSKKRKKLSTKMKNIMNNNSFILALLGIIVLAASVNLIELACSLGFPVIFSEILALNDVTGLSRIVYLLIYILFYMIDDILVFTISMITLNATGITNKYNKLCTLVSAIIMIIMGLLLLFKPDWLMLNF